MPERILEANNAQSRDLAWSDGGRSISVSGAGGTILTWQVATRDDRLIVRGPDDPSDVSGTVAEAATRFAATFLIPKGQTHVKVWDHAGKVLFTATDTVRETDNFPPRPARHVKLNRDGTLVAYCAYDRVQADGKLIEASRLRVWNVADGRELFHRDSKGGSFDRAAFSANGRLLATPWIALSGDGSSRKNSASVWDLDTGEERLHLDVPWLAQLAFSPDGRQLAAGLVGISGSGEMGELRIWDTTTGAVILTKKWTGDMISEPAYSRDGKMLAVACGSWGDDWTIKVLEAASGRELHSLAGHRSLIWKLAFSPDGYRLASCAALPPHPSDVTLWDLAAGRELLTLPTTEVGSIRNNSLAFSPDGHRLFYLLEGSRHDAEVQIWDATPLPDKRLGVPK